MFPLGTKARRLSRSCVSDCRVLFGFRWASLAAKEQPLSDKHSIHHPPSRLTSSTARSSHLAVMFKALIPRVPARSAAAALRSTSSHTSSAAIVRASPCTSLLQTRLSQRRGYATPAGMPPLQKEKEAQYSGYRANELQRRRISSSSVVAWLDMSPPSRPVRKASRCANTATELLLSIFLTWCV